MSEEDSNQRNHTTAALLSAIGVIVPIAAGLGQAYNGDYLRGVGFQLFK